jgi:hypothetical protein
MSRKFYHKLLWREWDLIPVARRGQQKSDQEIGSGDVDFSDQASPAGFSGKFGQTAPERPDLALIYVAMSASQE